MDHLCELKLDPATLTRSSVTFGTASRNWSQPCRLEGHGDEIPRRASARFREALR